MWVLSSQPSNLDSNTLTTRPRLPPCDLGTLATKRLRGNQIDVSKILNGNENIYRNMFFSLKKRSRTRGDRVALVKDALDGNIVKSIDFDSNIVNLC